MHTSLYLQTPDHQRLHSNMIMILTVRTHLDFSSFSPYRYYTTTNLQFLQASTHTVNKAVVCQGLHCKICMSQWNMHIAVCHQWHGFYKGYTTHMSACFSDSIPLTLIGVDTRKGSSGWIIKPSTNEFGVHLNMFHWTSHLLYFSTFSYGNKKKHAIKEAWWAREHCFWINCPKYI